MSYPGICFLCDESLNDGKTTTLKKKAINALRNKSKKYGDNKWKALERLTEITVHELCRFNYYLGRKVKNAEVSSSSIADAQQPFDFKADCFLCGKPWIPKNKPGRLVKTQNFQENIEKIITLRNDDSSQSVQARIGATCLLQAEARYHSTCYGQFTYIAKGNPRGRSKIAGLDAAFEGLCQWMEHSDDCQFILSQLMEKMEKNYTASTRMTL